MLMRYPSKSSIVESSVNRGCAGHFGLLLGGKAGLEDPDLQTLELDSALAHPTASGSFRVGRSLCTSLCGPIVCSVNRSAGRATSRAGMNDLDPLLMSIAMSAEHTCADSRCSQITQYTYLTVQGGLLHSPHLGCLGSEDSSASINQFFSASKM